MALRKPTRNKVFNLILKENDTVTAAAGKHLRRQIQRRLIKQHNYCSIVTNSLFRMVNAASINRYQSRESSTPHGMLFFGSLSLRIHLLYCERLHRRGSTHVAVASRVIQHRKIEKKNKNSIQPIASIMNSIRSDRSTTNKF